LQGHKRSFGLLTAIRKAKTNARCQAQMGRPALRVEAKHLASIFNGSKRFGTHSFVIINVEADRRILFFYIPD
jgi:hypothetical protein